MRLVYFTVTGLLNRRRVKRRAHLSSHICHNTLIRVPSAVREISSSSAIRPRAHEAVIGQRQGVD